MNWNIEYVGILIFVGIGIIYFLHKSNEVKYIKSNIDSNHYVVLNKVDAHQAADLLAVINKRLRILQDYLEKNHPDENIKNVKNKFDPINISEGSPDSQYTSYTVNKGEKMIFCIRDKESKKLHDINLMMYVALHELAHVISVTIGHNEEFHKNFKYLLKIAEELKIYSKLPLGQNSIKYCGLTL